MIVIRMKPRSVMASGEPVYVSDVARVMCDARLSVHDACVPLPSEAGVWLVDAGSIISVLSKKYPNEKINIIGDTIGWLQRLPGRGVKDQTREWLRLACCAVFSRMGASPEPKRKTSGTDSLRSDRDTLSSKGGDIR